jgi:hypothetical protein
MPTPWERRCTLKDTLWLLPKETLQFHIFRQISLEQPQVPPSKEASTQTEHSGPLEDAAPTIDKWIPKHSYQKPKPVRIPMDYQDHQEHQERPTWESVSLHGEGDKH